MSCQLLPFARGAFNNCLATTTTQRLPEGAACQAAVSRTFASFRATSSHLGINMRAPPLPPNLEECSLPLSPYLRHFPVFVTR